MLRVKKLFCMALACMSIIGCFRINAGAVKEYSNFPAEHVMEMKITRATASFDISIPAETKVIADTSFPLEAGETVTINASYSPFSSSVDFGLVDPNGRFHFLNVTGGSINKTIQIEERGNYTLAVRNNSISTVDVSGFVKY